MSAAQFLAGPGGIVVAVVMIVAVLGWIGFLIYHAEHTKGRPLYTYGNVGLLGVLLVGAIFILVRR